MQKRFNTYIIVMFAALMLFAFVRVGHASLTVPTIAVQAKNSYEGQWLYIDGTGDPDSSILVVIEPISGTSEPVSAVVQADGNGDWAYQTQSLKEGSYYANAATLKDGVRSDPSQSVVFMVTKASFFVGAWNISYAILSNGFVAAGLAALILLAVVLLWHNHLRRRMRRHGIRPEHLRIKTK